jgi:hypothetical protein
MLALAVVVKVTAALPVGLLVIERFAAARAGGSPVERRQAVGLGRRLTAGLVLGLALWLVLVPAGAIGWQRNLDCLARWCNLVPTKAIDTGGDLFAGDSYSVRNQSLVNAVRHLGNWIVEDVAGDGDSLRPVGPNDSPHAMEAPAVNRLLLAARLAVLVLAGLAAVWAGRRRDRLTTASLYTLGLVATLVVSPVARTHYFLLIAPAVLLLPWRFARVGRTRLAWSMAWMPTLIVVPQYLWPSAAGRVGWLGIGMTLWLVSGAVLLWTTGRKGNANPIVLSWRAAPPAEGAAAEVAPATATARPGRYRAAAASCAAGESDPSEN